jgi:hypothetical protein
VFDGWYFLIEYSIKASVKQIMNNWMTRTYSFLSNQTTFSQFQSRFPVPLTFLILSSFVLGVFLVILCRNVDLLRPHLSKWEAAVWVKWRKGGGGGGGSGGRGTRGGRGGKLIRNMCGTYNTRQKA